VAERFRQAPTGSTLFIDLPSLGGKTLLFVVASVVIMMVDRREGTLDSVRNALSVVVYPVQWAVDAPFALGHWMGDHLATRNTLIERNLALEAQQLETQAKLQRMTALSTENAQLRQLLGSSQRLDEQVLVSEVLAVDLDPFRHRVVLDKGSSEGVYEGQPLIDAAGVMGQIVSVGPLTSQAVLITDPSHALPVEVNRNGPLRAASRRAWRAADSRREAPRRRAPATRSRRRPGSDRGSPCARSPPGSRAGSVHRAPR